MQVENNVLIGDNGKYGVANFRIHSRNSVTVEFGEGRDRPGNLKVNGVPYSGTLGYVRASKDGDWHESLNIIDRADDWRKTATYEQKNRVRDAVKQAVTVWAGSEANQEILTKAEQENIRQCLSSLNDSIRDAQKKLDEAIAKRDEFIQQYGIEVVQE